MINNILSKLDKKEDLSSSEMQIAFEKIMTGKIDQNHIEEFLLSLNKKGITNKEISSAAKVMKEKALKFDVGSTEHIDTCGTGGTGLHTFNCSTASSFVASAGGAKITKHGNKAISSKSGSADFLSEAGANINHDRKQIETIFTKVGFVFLFAPLHHSSMKYVMSARQKIGQKTIFNMLGPHTNPCSAQKQIIGVYDKKLLSSFSIVAKDLEMEHVIVVHGKDGIDEISITDETYVSELKNNSISEYTLSPKQFGLSLANMNDISANSPKDSFKLVSEAFAGVNSPVQDMIALNAGAALYLSGQVSSIADGVENSFEIMNDGSALKKLTEYVSITNQ